MSRRKCCCDKPRKPDDPPPVDCPTLPRYQYEDLVEDYSSNCLPRSPDQVSGVPAGWVGGGFNSGCNDNNGNDDILDWNGNPVYDNYNGRHYRYGGWGAEQGDTGSGGAITIGINQFPWEHFFALANERVLAGNATQTCRIEFGTDRFNYLNIDDAGWNFPTLGEYVYPYPDRILSRASMLSEGLALHAYPLPVPPESPYFGQDYPDTASLPIADAYYRLVMGEPSSFFPFVDPWLDTTLPTRWVVGDSITIEFKAVQTRLANFFGGQSPVAAIGCEFTISIIHNEGTITTSKSYSGDPGDRVLVSLCHPSGSFEFAGLVTENPVPEGFPYPYVPDTANFPNRTTRVDANGLIHLDRIAFSWPWLDNFSWITTGG